MNATDSKGVSPLHEAVRSADRDLIQLLLGAGAFLDVCDVQGNTPLHYVAVVPECMSVVECLVAAGASVDLRNRYGCDCARCRVFPYPDS